MVGNMIVLEIDKPAPARSVAFLLIESHSFEDKQSRVYIIEDKASEDCFCHDVAKVVKIRHEKSVFFMILNGIGLYQNFIYNSFTYSPSERVVLEMNDSREVVKIFDPKLVLELSDIDLNKK